MIPLSPCLSQWSSRWRQAPNSAKKQKPARCFHRSGINGSIHSQGRKTTLFKRRQFINLLNFSFLAHLHYGLRIAIPKQVNIILCCFQPVDIARQGKSRGPRLYILYITVEDVLIGRMVDLNVPQQLATAIPLQTAVSFQEGIEAALRIIITKSLLIGLGTSPLAALVLNAFWSLTRGGFLNIASPKYPTESVVAL